MTKLTLRPSDVPGTTLLLPLHRLTPAGERVAAPAPAAPLPRTLDLDQITTGSAVIWRGVVAEAAEACLLLDDTGRLVAVSAAAGRLLQVQPEPAVGAEFRRLVDIVDFSSRATDDPAAAAAAPPLRALRGPGMARGLLRLRLAGGELVTYDVVSVPLQDGRGSLSFLTVV